MLKKILANPLLLTAALLTIAAVTVFIVLAVTSQPSLDDGAKVTVRVDTHRVSATVAAAPATQNKGLGGSQPLTDKQGLLFVYPEAQIPTYYMKDVSFPIDIIWINGDTVTDVTQNVAPEPGVAEDQLKRYSPPGPVDKVLEVNAGFASRYGIQPGDPIRISSF